MNKSTKEKVKKYLELKEKYSRCLKCHPIGDRIQKNGILENKIKQVFNKNRQEQILKRSKNFDNNMFKNWQNIKTEMNKLRKELEQLNILTYNEEGEEQIKC